MFDSLKGALKAIIGFIVAFGGALAVQANGGDVFALDLGAWLEALLVGAVGGGGVYAIPNKGPGAATTKAVTSVAAVEDAVDALRKKAIDAVNEVQATVGELAAAAKPAEVTATPLAQSIIDSYRS